MDNKSFESILTGWGEGEGGGGGGGGGGEGKRLFIAVAYPLSSVANGGSMNEWHIP